jgi:hypothetical protein
MENADPMARKDLKETGSANDEPGIRALESI